MSTVNNGEADPPSPSSETLLPPTAASSSEPSDEKELLISVLLAVKAELEASKRDRVQQAEQRDVLSKELKAATRRHTRVLVPATPLPSVPKVSQITSTSYANLSTPSVRTRHSTRLSVGDVGAAEEVKDGYVEVDDGDAVENRRSPSRPLRSASTLPPEVDEDKEAAKLAKVMSKTPVPEKYSGETDKEREDVESWVESVDDYLAGQFGQLAGEYPQQEWTLMRSLLKGTAKKWFKSAKDTDPTQTWETLKDAFVEFIQGGSESRSLLMEKMEALVYGQDKCKDLLSLEKEFEQLRIKLFPSSSSDPAMNALVGRMYGDAIKRGDRRLYAEMLRALIAKDQPTLADWKTAAVKANHIQKAIAHTLRGASRPATGYQPRWGQAPRATGETLNEIGEGEREEGETDAMAEAAVQQVEGRPSRPGRPPQRGQPFRLADDIFALVKAKNLCVQCYWPGHYRGDVACKERGRPRRAPTAEDMKRIKA